MPVTPAKTCFVDLDAEEAEDEKLQPGVPRMDPTYSSFT